ncbi:MAG: gliding motility-associated C-terminal domain-containing protein [Bacteroidales bacterium]|nr:gliding motility-associated C-terminal domain-containing protein [Bacteroidales bacterium]
MKRYIITILILLATSIVYSQHQSVTTQGTEFWAAFLLNSDHSVGDSGLELSLMVTAKRACSVTVRNPNSTWTNTFNVGANATYKCVIPTSQHSQCYLNSPTSTAVNKGLLITSTDTISLYASNFASASFDGSIVLPTTALGNEYIIQTYKPTLAGYTDDEACSEFSVTATEDNTIVDVTPSVSCYTNSSATTTSNFTITLNRGQSAFIKSATRNENGNLSGTRVIARDCKKIAVFNGNNTTQVPSGNYGDHIYEQAFPTTSWGKKFVITNTLQNASTGRTKDCVRVTASTDNTTIRKNNTLLTTINAGQTYEFQLTATEKAAYIETSNPCAVYMYLVSQTAGGSSLGDPSMVWVAPLEQRINNIVFNTFYPNISAANTPSTHIVNIVTETATTSQVRLDGSTMTGWETVSGYPNYSFVRKVISHAAHSITTTGGNGFIAHVYGIGDVVSYAYSVGSMATNLAERMYINGIGSTDANVEGTFCEGQEITFTSEIDYDYDNIIWNFGDGTTYTGNATTHTYQNQGTYTVNMQVNSNGSGCTSFSNSVNFDITIGRVWDWEVTSEANYGETITVEGVTFVARHDTTIIQTYPSVLTGCDSTVTHNVIIRTIVNDIYAEICEGETYNENGFSELTTGTYTHTTTLPSGMDSITNLYLVVRENPIASITGNNALCNGSVNLVANGGESYSWSNNESTSGITITEPGTYTVTVTNEFGCTATARKQIAREIQINVSYDPILCNGNSTEVTVTAQYGIPPYTGERTETVRAGSRTYRVTDSEGCTAQATIDITEPEAITNEREEAEAYCSEEFGTVTIIPQGGVTPYSILWEDGSTNFTNNRIIPGQYNTYTISDANGCTFSDSTKISQEPPITITITHENVSCNNGINGSISVTNVNNGHEPYSYNWNNNQTGATAINLAAGNYQVTVTDDHNCTATATISITQPDALTVEGSVKNASCIGLCDGRIAVEANGGTPSYSYRWSTGYDMAELTELCAGTYNLTVTDANGCSTNRSYTIIQPDQMTASATATDVTCYAGNDGKITVMVSGGTTPYSYALNEFMSESSTDNTITALSAGHHVIYIRDAKNCMARTEATIGSPERLLAEYETINVSCKEASDGEIHVSAIGGHPPYYITTNAISEQPIADNPAITGLRSGTYHLIVTDSTDCSYSLKNIRIPENLNECIHVPNVFTPNDDGINDTWEITHIDMYPDAKIFVYNRWGQKMYEGNGTSEYWNGEYRGKKVPAGTYFYVVELGEGHNTYSGPLSILY